MQVFQNLGIIDGAVDTTIESTLSDIERISTESLDVSLMTNQDFGKRGAPGRAAIPSPGSSGNLRTKIWENLERLFQDTLYTQCLQVSRQKLLYNSFYLFLNGSQQFLESIILYLDRVATKSTIGTSYKEFSQFVREILG